MFDFWRNLTKSKAEKEQEQLHAYIDNALSANERADFEARLVQDEALRAEANALRQVKQMMAAVPRRRVPRNFTLDPAQYGRPARQPLIQAQPVLRLATAVTAIIFVVALALDWVVPGEMQTAGFEADMIAQEEVAVMVERSVEVITETITEEMETFAITAEDAEEEIVPESAPVGEDEIIPTAPPESLAEAAVGDLVTRTITTETEVVVTAVPPPHVPTDPAPVTSSQWLQLGLGALLALLLLLLFVARRQVSI